MDKRIARVLPLLVAAACHKAAARQARPPTVEVAEVMQIDLQMRHQWVATLAGFVNADIRPQVEGYVRKQVYRDGAYVQQGDVLFLIDPRNYKAALDNAKSTLAHNVAALEKARLDVKRDRELIAGQFIPQQQLDNDLTAEREAEANVASARAALAQAELNHGWTQVTSPLSGIAGIAQMQVGSLVSTSTVMTTVSQVDPIKAEFNISELDYLRSATGTHWADPEHGAGPAHGEEPVLELMLEDGSTYPHGGIVVAINRQVDPRTGTIAMLGAFPNPGNLLRPGQYGKIRAAIETRRGALLVPVRALNEIQGSYQIGVVDGDGKVDVRTVQIGEQVANELIVERGVQAKEKVIVEGFARVRPGMLVSAKPSVFGSRDPAAPSVAGGGR
jgi:membrane fusion protein (multidrug efflux system)